MGRILVRLALLAAGLGVGELAFDVVAHNDPIAFIEMGLAVLLLVAGSAGFVVPLLAGGTGQEVPRHG